MISVLESRDLTIWYESSSSYIFILLTFYSTSLHTTNEIELHIVFTLFEEERTWDLSPCSLANSLNLAEKQSLIDSKL